ncbi:MAG: transglutaminase protein [Frankiales bacterium]|jgi:transglutaminase-like putative cysteine protease|nr:transglutaminase protein [Frankiales bacterium]
MTWRLRVHHETGYRYDTEVVSSYNEARLTPQTEPGQLTLEARVKTSPAAAQYRYWDYWGTQVTAFEVHEPHAALEVVVTSVVETADGSLPPVDAPGWDALRVAAQGEQYEWICATPRTVPDAELTAAGIDAAAGLDPGGAALAIAKAAADRVTYESGSTGVQTSASEAWRLRRGVCQDIAHVSIAMLRAAGLPARYVSGYLHPVTDAPIGTAVTGESHAWVEVWLGRWWAYDPTNRVPVGERHVVVARGREYGDVPPLKGVYRGHGSHSLGVRVELTRLR